MTTPFLRLLAMAAIGFGLIACSSAGNSEGPSSSAGGTSGPAMSASDTPMGSGDMVEVGALGESADGANADRTVRITASDQLTFDPDAVQIKVGETVTFEIENTGSADHEFVLGSAEYQAAHEEEMQAGHMDMEDDANATEVPAGSTTSITWTFTEAGTTQFGCHEPGHFAAGMVGDITVSQ